MIETVITKRRDDIDIEKGLGMLLVIWAHILLTGALNWFIYLFHMPLFFFISGMLFKPEKYRQCAKLVKSRVHSLLLPYAFYSILTWIIWIGFSVLFKRNTDSYWTPLLQTVIAQGSDGFLEHNPPLWFVLCLFSVEIIFCFLSKIKGAAIKLILSVCITALGYCMIEMFSFFRFDLLPWSLEVAFAALIFYAAGNIYGHSILKLTETIVRKGFPVFLLGAVFCGGIVLLCSQITKHISYGSDSLGSHPALVYVGAFAGIFLMALLANGMMAIRGRSHVLDDILKYVVWVGKNSFRFMALHYPIKGVVAFGFAKILHTSSEALGSSIPFSLVIFIITLLVTSIFTFLIDRTKNKRVKGSN